MANNVFISFRYADGCYYKNKLSGLFDAYYDTVDFSEDVDRSMMSEETIRNYLYKKLKRASVTVILLTPMAINHNKNRRGEYDDWMYDEIRYSLEDRNNNPTKGIVAVYTKESRDRLLEQYHTNLRKIFDVDNLFRKNMMNIKENYKINPNQEIYNTDYDSYCSLIEYGEFPGNPGKYISIAIKKRRELYKYNIVRRL